jgi:hypothetical protein
MTCQNKIKSTCGGKKMYSTCVFEEMDFPSWSTLYAESCVVQSEINAEVYSELSDIRIAIDVSTLATTCFDIDTTATNEITAATAITTLIREVAALKCPLPTDIPNDLVITTWGINFLCLEDACGIPITKLSSTLQLLINQVCAIQTEASCCSLELSRQSGDYTLEDIYVNGALGIGVTVGLGGGGIDTNVAYGVRSLISNTTGTGNVASGYYSMNNNLSGAQNVGIGNSALTLNTSGSFNIAIGYNALSVNLTANNNTAVGARSLTANTTGASNTAIGYNSGINITTGASNTILGAGSGTGLTTGSYNTIIGAGVTGLSATLANSIILATGAGSIKLQYNNTKGTWSTALPTFATNAAAITGGLVANDLYKKVSGSDCQVMIVI